MILKNVKLLNEAFEFTDADISFGETIESIAPSDGDGTLYAIPGLVDIHTHGAVGTDAMDEDVNLGAWTSYMNKNGITTFFPTTVTGSTKELSRALERLRGTDGVNLEGPFLAVSKKGAHDASKIIPADTEFVRKYSDIIKITTIAPETEENLRAIPEIAEMGVRVSLGHSAADYETAKKAFSMGATQLTHTFNAMNPLTHREPGMIGAALSDDNVFCEVISDGFHLHGAVVNILYRLLGADRMVLISDAMRATGLSDGEYTLGGLAVRVKDGKARLSDGTIAGSTSNLMNMLRHAVSFGVPLNEAVKMASLTPARAVGIADRVGSLAVGKRADIVILDKALNIIEVYCRGIKLKF